MLCSQIDQHLNDLFDGELAAEQEKDLRAHLAGCEVCHSAYASFSALRTALKDLPVEAPRPEFFAKALAVAVRKRRRTDRMRRSPWMVTSAAASIALLAWLTIGVMRGEDAPTRAIPQVTIALETTSSINLVFAAADDLADARVSLQLPDGLEVDGYRGRREISWTTHLHRGKNVLRVPLLAHAAPTEALIARLDHGGSSKTFQLNVRVI